MPSLHFAVPAAIALWSWSRIGRAFSAAMAAYAFAIGFAVVFLGEHNVLDVAAGGGLAVGTVVTTSWLEKVRLPQIRLSRARGGMVSESGQNLIEFALLTPLVLFFIGAIVVFGLALYARSNLQQAVREGARQAAVGQSLAEVQDLAAGNGGGTIDPNEVAWCHPAGPTGTHGKVGDPVMVYLVDDDDGVPGNGDGPAGVEYTLASASGILNVVGLKNLSVRMSPHATARLEKSVPAGSLNTACP
jgi:hypothetical protein